MTAHADTIRRYLAGEVVGHDRAVQALDALLAERLQAIDERDALAEQIQGRRRGEPLGNCFESVRQALGWPPDASYEGMFADARKAWQEVLDGLSESERKRYDAEARCEQAIDALREAQHQCRENVRRAAFAPEIGTRYTEKIRLAIADECRKLEDGISAALVSLGEKP